MPGKLLLFCGPSGSGKTTIVQHLLKNNPRLQFSVSATTRPKRDQEVDGVDYYFISVEDFKARIISEEFVEWEEVYTDRFYGTLKKEVERIRFENRIVVFDVDVEGGLNIKKQYGNDLMAIFVMPPSIEVLQQRLQSRLTESADTLATRIKKAKHELTYAYRFDKIIINDTLETALDEAQRLVDAFLQEP